MTRTCVVIAAPTVGTAIREGRKALRAGSDLVELRLDHLRDPSPGGVERLGEAFGKAGIATLRSRPQGGRWRRRRTDLLLAAARAGFGYLDIEVVTDRGDLEALRREARRSKTRVIASHHFLEGRPASRVGSMLDRCCRTGDIGKVAVTPRGIAAAVDLLDVAREFRRRKRRFILIGMGDRAAITRVLAAEMGCEIQYVRPDAGGGTAPGQLSLMEWRRLSGGRRRIITGLLGRPIGHSISTPMQNAAFRAAGLRGVYLPFEAAGRSDLRALLESPRVRGLNVTMPFKEEVIDLLDRCDPDARESGAVNTIRIEAGEAVGFNTDLYGFRRLLESVPVRRAERALVVGAGGAARAAIRVLSAGIADEVRVVNRSPGRARRLARWARGTVRLTDPARLRDEGPFDLVVHCTPVGTAGGKARGFLPAGLFRKGVTLIDLVTNPAVTTTMRTARRRGARAVGGLEMLVHQGARSFEIWTGRRAPVRAMRNAARRALDDGAKGKR